MTHSARSKADADDTTAGSVTLAEHQYSPGRSTGGVQVALALPTASATSASVPTCSSSPDHATRQTSNATVTPSARPRALGRGPGGPAERYTARVDQPIGLSALVDDAAFLSFEHQMHLADVVDRLGEHEWRADLDGGVLELVGQRTP